ncbi:inositol monophosphatase [Reichenbachiella agarivorans]|uniref:Inositol-1-monophosphatase n=1 Tax=Reichenbachiella agarivorans TaxID=2979464 RepID=A0ABY6CXF8_9BACT|nr:inositol monophosphatase family protein [Reichenbachiella agarivorans]UXP34133.1 inositol monophosphatase [Reichenbachiella agarivorans]
MNLKNITEEVIKLSIVVGAFIKKEGENFEYAKVEEKGKNDLVSYVDKEAEKLIVTALKEILPEAGFITEENTVEEGDEELKWIIDPLDGTTNFIHGLPCYSTSIALARGEELLIGVVYDIGQGDCYHAYQGGGAFRNHEKIVVSSTHRVADSLIATGFPYYNFEKMDKYISILMHLMQNSHGLRRMGSAAIDLVYTAIGRYEGFFEYNLNSYDVAAGALIVKEAGGKVTNFSGGDDFLFKREIVAACGIHDEFLDVINRHW